jgi:formylglycine-generating enzyme required for sulfatase activity
VKRPLLLISTLLLCGCPQASGPSSKTGAAASPQASPTTSGPTGRPRRGEIPLLSNVVLEAGEFVMGSEGSSKGGQDDERPRKSRFAMAFTLDRHEVTNADYAKFLASPDCTEHTFCHADEPDRKDHRPAKANGDERTWGATAAPFSDPGRERHPVVGVDWFDAYAFAAWVGRRLPSEHEWERAARGTEGRVFPWGSEPPKQGTTIRAAARCARDGMTEPVGSYPDGAAECGALDLAGNAWEWTNDPYVPYEGAPKGGAQILENNVFRGGGWSSASAFLLRAAKRHSKPRTYRSAALGFRTAGAATDRRGENK